MNRGPTGNGRDAAKRCVRNRPGAPPASASAAGDIDVSVVLPCLNEAPSVAKCVAAAREAFGRLDLAGEVVVVDNGSVDESARLAREAGARVVCERFPGYGMALRSGIAASSGRVIVMADADGTYDLAGLGTFVSPLLNGEADLVIGNRFADIRSGAMPRLHRYLGNPLLSGMLRFLFRAHVRDVHCGMRAFTRSAYERLRLTTIGMEFASEMIIRSVLNGLRVRDVDISYHARYGESKLRTWRDGWRHLRLMLIYSPNVIFLVPAAVCWTAGAVIVAALYPSPLWFGSRMVDLHTMIFGMLLNLAGLQLGAAGVVAKSYGHFSGLRPDAFVSVWSGRVRLEHGIAAAGLLGTVAAAFLAAVVVHWAHAGFGDVMRIRDLLLGLVLMSNALVVLSTSFLLSLMVIPHSHGFEPHADAPGQPRC